MHKCLCDLVSDALQFRLAKVSIRTASMRLDLPKDRTNRPVHRLLHLSKHSAIKGGGVSNTDSAMRLSVFVIILNDTSLAHLKLCKLRRTKLSFFH